jgi:hypothetical protein
MSKCKICGHTCSTTLAYFNQQFSDVRLFDDAQILVCEGCGFGESFPILSDADIEYFYTHIYRAETSPFYIDFTKLFPQIRTDYRSVGQLLLAMQYSNWQPYDLFVDIGPGSGSSFDWASRMLDTPKMAAVEYSDGAKKAYQRLYGVETFTSLPQLVASKKTRPKVILSSHSLEHFTHKSALELLSDVKVCLDATGVFILEVPNVDLRFIENNRSDDSPHFMFFSQESLRLFFESNGFNVLFCQSCGVLQQHTRELIGNSVSEYPIKTHLKYIFKKIMYFLGVKIPLNLNNRDLIYGDNRVCLRMVVSLQK